MKNKGEQLKKIKNERGLTLVELLAVIVILGIISTIAFVSINGVIDNSKKDAQIANAQQIIAAAKLYEVTDDDFDTITVDTLQTSGHLEDIVDPWSKKVSTEAKAGEVTKSEDGGYSITLTGGEDNEYKIDGITETELRTLSRKQIFGE